MIRQSILSLANAQIYQPYSLSSSSSIKSSTLIEIELNSELSSDLVVAISYGVADFCQAPWVNQQRKYVYHKKALNLV